jgi:hypothetical protein
LKNKLAGDWVRPGEVNDHVFTFADNDTLYVTTRAGDKEGQIPYQVIAEDSIRTLTRNKVVFYTSDSILIGDFLPGIAAIYPPQYWDVTLKRWSGDEESEGSVGYVVGYETCGFSIDDRTAAGYIIITEDLQDTLAVYNLPEIFEFPLEAFPITTPSTGIINEAFPEQFRYAFKMRFSYTLSSEDEVRDLGMRKSCAIPAMYPIRRTFRVRTFVIIDSAVKMGAKR